MSNYYPPYPPAGSSNPPNPYNPGPPGPPGPPGAPPYQNISQGPPPPLQPPFQVSHSQPPTSLPPPPSFLPQPPLHPGPSAYDPVNSGPGPASNAYRPYENGPPPSGPPRRYDDVKPFDQGYPGPSGDYGRGRGDDSRRGGRGGGQRGGRRDGGGDRHRSPDGRRDSGRLGQRDHKEERPRKESKCRTLFVRNVSYDANVEWLRQSFSSYGEVKEFFELVTKRGLIFITYFDLRAAEKAREAMHNTKVEGRPIDVHYSLPRDDDLHGPCGRDKNQGSILVNVRENAQLNEMELGRMCERFGEVRSVHRARNPGAKVVEFWDSRGANLFVDQMNGQSHQGGAMTLRYLWDEPELDDVLGGFSPPRKGERRNQDGRDSGPRERYQPPANVKFESHTNRYNAPMPDRRESFGREDHRGGYNAGPPPPGPPGPPGPHDRYRETPPAAPPLNANDPRLEQAQRIQQLLGSLSGSTASAPPPPSSLAPSHSGGYGSGPPPGNASFPPPSPRYGPPPAQGPPSGPPGQGASYAPPAPGYQYDPRSQSADPRAPPGPPGSGPNGPPPPHINPNGPAGRPGNGYQPNFPPAPARGYGPGPGPGSAPGPSPGAVSGQGQGQYQPVPHGYGPPGGPPGRGPPGPPPMGQQGGGPPPPMNDVSSLLAMLKK